MLHSLLDPVRCFIFESTVLSTVRAGSRPRGSGVQDCLMVGFLVGPFFKLIVGEEMGVLLGMKEDTPAHVFGFGTVAGRML